MWFLMRYLNSHPAGGDVHISSALTESMLSADQKIWEPVKALILTPPGDKRRPYKG
jgi:hypothetical protein